MNPTISENSSGENESYIFSNGWLLYMFIHVAVCRAHLPFSSSFFSISIFDSFYLPRSLAHSLSRVPSFVCVCCCILQCTFLLSLSLHSLTSSHSTVILSTHRKITYIYIDLRKAKRRQQNTDRKKILEYNARGGNIVRRTTATTMTMMTVTMITAATATIVAMAVRMTMTKLPFILYAIYSYYTVSENGIHILV